MRVGIIGYGGAFNMGQCHLNSILKNKGFEAAAICDVDPVRTKQALADYPQVQTYNDPDEMLRKAKLDLVIVITPHNTHAELVIKALKAGCNVVCEKPLAITSDEVKEMLAAAKKKKVMLSTFHNRRWDGDFITLQKLIKEGWIGKMFRIEAGFNGYGQQGLWWRAFREISGGAIYDWGAHFTDWMLLLTNSPIEYVTGFQVKHPQWSKYTNEDHSEYTMKLANGCLATLTISNMAMEGKPRWRILGDNGSILDDSGRWLVRSTQKGRQVQMHVPFQQSDWDGYYHNVAKHLTKGSRLEVTPESAARVIGVLHAANLSAAQGGKPVVPAFK